MKTQESQALNTLIDGTIVGTCTGIGTGSIALGIAAGAFTITLSAALKSIALAIIFLKDKEDWK